MKLPVDQIVKTQRAARRVAKKEAARKELFEYWDRGIDTLKHITKDPYLTLAAGEGILALAYKMGFINWEQFLRGTAFNSGFNILRAGQTESSSIAGLSLMGLSAVPGLRELTGVGNEDPTVTLPLIEFPPPEGMEIVGNRSDQPPREGCRLIRKTFLGNVWECPKK